MTLVLGARLGPYEILAPLGAGGMGEVYKAHDTRLQRAVAVKVLPAEVATDPNRLRRFEQEARAVAALNHPNILAIYDIGSTSSPAAAEGGASSTAPSPSVQYLVTELLEGQTLAARIAEGPLPIGTAMDVGGQIVRGLAAAHGKHIVHRDLKPANVFMTTDGQVKLLDFGIAKLVAPTEVENEAPTVTARDATEMGVRVGTVGYMAPEQVRGLTVDGRADLFAFGAVLYEMLAGRRAFAGETAADTLSAILMKEPAPLTGPASAVPASLQAIVTRCLEKRAEDRFQSATDLGFALQAIGTASGSDAAGQTAPPPASQRARDPRWWRWAALAGALGVVAVVSTLVVPRLRAPVPTTTGTPAVAAGIRLAVLPFANLSGDPSQDYFADGVTESLTTTLSQLKALSVTSSTSAMTFRKPGTPLRDIARALNVEWIVEGSAHRAGDHLRLTARLINARTDTQAWAETYDRALQDILTLQGQMARSVALEVGALLTPRERLRLATARPIEPELFDLTVRGWQALNKGGPEDMNTAIDCFSQAASRDTTYAPAHAGLSLAYYTAALYGVRAYRDVLPMAKAAAQRAVALDDFLPDAHAALANVILVLDWDWAGADREYRRVLELAPDSAVASLWVGWYLTIVERFDEAITIRKRALSLDPLSVPANDVLGWTLMYAGRYDESIRQYEKLLDMQPEHPYAYMWLAFNYAATHQTDRVVAVCRKALALAPDDLSILSYCAADLAAVGKRSDALGLIDRVTTLSKKTPVEPYLLAYAYAALGERARALDLLARSVDERSPNAVMLNLDFASTLGSEPRYQALMRRMNHPVRAPR